MTAKSGWRAATSLAILSANPTVWSRSLSSSTLNSSPPFRTITSAMRLRRAASTLAPNQPDDLPLHESRGVRR